MTDLTTLADTAFDITIYDKYLKLYQENTPFNVFEAHPERVEEERHRFMTSGYTHLPDLRPRTEEVAGLRAAERKLEKMRQTLPTSLPNANVRRAYHWRINEDLTDIKMIFAAAGKDVRRFRACNLYLYGAPRPEIFRAVCDWFACESEPALQDPRAEVSEAAAELLGILGPHRSKKDILVPEDRVFQSVRAREYGEAGFMRRLLSGVELPANGSIDAKGGDVALHKMLVNLDCPQEIEDADSWGATSKALCRPAQYYMSTQEFIEFAAHEFRHLIEIKEGTSSNIRLISTGLDHYSLGNEGRAVITEEITNKTFEQFTKGFRWHELLGRHLAVSLSCGLSGRSKNFAETYRVIKSALFVFEARRLNATENIEQLTKLAEDRAWDILLSAYEGTDGSGKGGGWRRPMIYLEGSVRIWQDETNHPGIIELGDLGKFNISNPQHIKILQAAGILHPGTQAARQAP